MLAVWNMQAPPAIGLAISQVEKRRRAVANAVLIACFALAQFPLLAVFFQRLWSNEHYRAFPLLLLASAWLFYRRWPDTVVSLNWRDRLVGLASLLVGFALQTAAVYLWSPWLAYASALFLGLFLLVQLGYGAAIPELGGVWLMLWLLLPLPAELDRELVLWLQNVSSHTASTWLDALGYNHVLSGHVIHVPGQRFLVEEACSGTNSFFVMLSLAAMFVVALRYPLLPALLLLASTLVWAIVANALRIVLLVTLFAGAGINLTTGLGHTMLGLGTFGIALLLLLSTDRFLLFLLAPTRPPDVPTLDARDKNGQGSSANAEAVGGDVPVESAGVARSLLGRFATVLVIVTLLFFGAAQIYAVANSDQPYAREREVESETLAEVERVGLSLDASAIQQVPEGWEFVRFDQQDRSRAIGTHSSLWEFRRGDSTAQISLDFPFPGWHELPICYTIQGWELMNRSILPNAGDHLDETSATLAFEMENPTGEFGYVMVSLFDRQGTRLPPPPNPSWTWDGFVEDVMSRLSRRGIAPEKIRPVYQFQIFLSSKSPLTLRERERIAGLYFAARKQIVAQLCGREEP
jgi:exosortase